VTSENVTGLDQTVFLVSAFGPVTGIACPNDFIPKR
jgi:hypothetical protein